MISIKFKNISFEKIEKIISLAKNVDNNNQTDNTKNDSDITIETVIENYLLSCNDNKAELAQCLINLTKQEITELLALYYFFSRLTYSTDIIPDEELDAFWELCNLNSSGDIDRLGLNTMIDYLKEKPNLVSIFSTAVINLKK